MLKEAFEKANDIELMESYGELLAELKKRNLIRTRHVVAELAESFVFKLYKESPNLPNLFPAPKGTRNIDAISEEGKRYEIKSTTGKATGAFYGLPTPHLDSYERTFEYAVIVEYSDNYTIDTIYELSWEDFLKVRRGPLRQYRNIEAWNIILNKNFRSVAKIVYQRENSN